jgi:hypothetical protein
MKTPFSCRKSIHFETLLHVNCETQVTKQKLLLTFGAMTSIKSHYIAFVLAGFNLVAGALLWYSGQPEERYLFAFLMALIFGIWGFFSKKKD